MAYDYRTGNTENFWPSSVEDNLSKNETQALRVTETSLRVRCSGILFSSSQRSPCALYIPLVPSVTGPMPSFAALQRISRDHRAACESTMADLRQHNAGTDHV